MIIRAETYKYLICMIIILSIISVGCTNSSERYKQKYPVGKDTIRAFRDGTFQIYKTSTNTHIFMKEPEGAVIDKNIYAYKEEGNLVYTWGAIGFTIVNLTTYQVKQYRDFNGYTKKEIEDFRIFNDDKRIKNIIILDEYTDFSQEERKIFNDLIQRKRKNYE